MDTIGTIANQLDTFVLKFGVEIKGNLIIVVSEERMDELLRCVDKRVITLNKELHYSHGDYSIPILSANHTGFDIRYTWGDNED